VNSAGSRRHVGPRPAHLGFARAEHGEASQHGKAEADRLAPVLLFNQNSVLWTRSEDGVRTTTWEVLSSHNLIL